jgi:hypothetical protein
MYLLTLICGLLLLLAERVAQPDPTPTGHDPKLRYAEQDARREPGR